MTPLTIPNRTARALWLSSQQLSATPTGRLDLQNLIERLGMVQLDTIQFVARAHDHILWSRNQNYRPKHLQALYKKRAVFEHFTHDASILPMSLFPLWARQFDRLAEKIEKTNWWGCQTDPADRAAIKERIKKEGPLCSADFDADAPRPKEMWSRPPHKKALDYMWYSGELATCHRRGFTKVYDLAERIFPAPVGEHGLTPTAQVDGLCAAALDRMGFGTLSEVRRFWDATDVAEVKDWSDRTPLVPLRVQGADGAYFDAVGPADIERRLNISTPTSRLRILNPFDPVIRDRVRLQRLFGFEYRNEMFVPRAKRIWGYYVFPLLEGDRFVGRLEAKAHRSEATLEVLNFWPEGNVRWGNARILKLDAELDRIARFVECKDVLWTGARPGT